VLRKTKNKAQTQQTTLKRGSQKRNRDEDSPHFFSLNVEEWIMMILVMKHCLLDLFVVLDLDLEPI
jgi:hypothetical protein